MNEGLILGYSAPASWGADDRLACDNPSGCRLRQPCVALTALVVLFGLQTLRLYFPLSVFILRDRFGANSAQLGLYALVIFALGVACGVWSLGTKGPALRSTVGGLTIARFGLQLWWGDPLLDLALASLGIIFFLGALPLCLRESVLGLPLGLVLDSALHGAWRSYDLGWRNEFLPLIVMTFLCLGALLLLQSRAVTSARSVSSGALFALGPFLFLQVVVFGNLARLTVLSGWTQPAAFAGILLSQIAALGLAYWLSSDVRLQGRWMAALLAFSLLGSLSVAWPRGFLAPVCVLLGQVGAVGILTLLNAPGLESRSRSSVKVVTPYGLGALSLVALTFLYYAGYDLAIPLSNSLLPPAAGVLLGLVGLAFAGRTGVSEPEGEGVRATSLLAGAALLLLLPLFQYSTQTEPSFSRHPGGPVRLMTYNLHNGFDPQGQLGLEALALAIEAQKPDVVAFQELSRGWAVYGSIDMLLWLSTRLGMPYTYGPTADPLWGSALLSRYPIRQVQKIELPFRDLPLRRALIWCEIELEDGPLRVLATHFHHRFGDSEVRQAQARKVLEISRGSPRTVLLGDFNARPDTPEMRIVKEGGYRSAGPNSALTFPSEAPEQRIDYIWLSPDLRESNFAVSSQPASDHLGVAVTVETR